MSIFYLALAAGFIIAVAYLGLVVEEFLRSRREYLAGIGGADDAHDPLEYERQEGGFSWVAAGAVVVSTLLIVLISVTGRAWYILPLLSLGSAVAVIVAFVSDRQRAGVEAGQ
jgi:hypothetical protein